MNHGPIGEQMELGIGAATELPPQPSTIHKLGTAIIRLAERVVFGPHYRD